MFAQFPEIFFTDTYSTFTCMCEEGLMTVMSMMDDVNIGLDDLYVRGSKIATFISVVCLIAIITMMSKMVSDGLHD
jgi:hypothetical protein